MTPHHRFGRRHHRSAHHVESCGECAAAQRRERQYIERLRGAEVPPASHDLTARLLAQTEMLATAPPPPSPAQNRAARVLAFTAGGTAAAAGVLAMSAFALAGDNLPAAGNAMSGSLVQHTAQLPASGGQLNEEQLIRLRSEGWACPELESLGFHLQSARTTSVRGLPAVELRLWDGQHYATILEQHTVPEQHATPEQYSASPQSSPVGELRIVSTKPWTATYQTPAGILTFESDLPADQADDAAPVLAKLSALAAEGIDAGPNADPAHTQAGAPDESLGDRLQRGIRKITEMLTP